MSSHDIHQLFFEKYLRKKMDKTERENFEERLKSDADLLEAFEKYKLNRKRYLREMLQEEYPANKSPFSLNSMLYLLVSLICLLIAAGYFFDNKQLRSILAFSKLTSQSSTKNRSPNIIKTPPVLEIKVAKKETALPDLELVKSDISVAESDIILLDTVISVAVDIQDTSSTPSTILAEIWHSPVGFKGYRYNGVLLQLYGIETFSAIELYSEKGDLWLKLQEKHILLNSDFNYHKF